MVLLIRPHPLFVFRSFYLEWAEMAKWLESKFTNRKVRGSNPTFASRFPLSRPGQLVSIPAFLLLSVYSSIPVTVSNETCHSLTKARVAFVTLRHLWRQTGISLNLKERVYQATVRGVLLYGSETWSFRAAELRCL
ncbi:hypothetical protein CSKR_104400 [Clonorchis sinensis]|uniref:Uncharacterized protein n=1 Tax=Clonorchis sinensis TaxID=79923 RepID=A0A3R7GBT6_CLOSI|nr:hypothetical protein CSKR_104400 [Clonorchis sinensis]